MGTVLQVQVWFGLRSPRGEWSDHRQGGRLGQSLPLAWMGHLRFNCKRPQPDQCIAARLQPGAEVHWAAFRVQTLDHGSPQVLVCYLRVATDLG